MVVFVNDYVLIDLFLCVDYYFVVFFEVLECISYRYVVFY